MNTGRPYRFWILAALGLYSLFFLVYTYPLATNPADLYIGKEQSGDASQYVWNVWHFSHAVKQGVNPFKTTFLLYPEGASLYMHAYVPIVGLLNLIVNNPVLSINIILYLSFVFGALGMALLARHFGARLFLSILAGFIYSYFPYKTAHLAEHLNLELTACIPFYILFFIKSFSFSPGKLLPSIVSKKHLWYLLLTGFICLLSDYYYTIYLAYFSLLYLLLNYLLPLYGRLSTKNKILCIAAIFIGGHFIIRLLAISGADDKGALWWSADLAALILPPVNSALYGNSKAVQQATASVFRYPESVEFVMFLGFGFILMIILSLFRRKQMIENRSVKLLLGLSILFLLFCFPEVKICGKRLFYNITGLIYYIPFVNNVRTPPRYELMVAVLFLPAFSVALSSLWHKVSARLFIVTASLFLCVEFMPSSYAVISKKSIPAVYKTLASMPEGAMLPLPCGMRDGFVEQGHFNTNQFLYQTLHHKPIIGGYLSRLKPEAKIFFEHSGTISDIIALQDHKQLPDTHAFDLPVRYVVLEKSSAPAMQAYFDKVLQGHILQKDIIEGDILYRLY